MLKISSENSKRSWFHKVYTIKHHLLGAKSENGYVENPVSLSKNIFSASKFFMHILSMSITYLQSVEKIQWKL